MQKRIHRICLLLPFLIFSIHILEAQQTIVIGKRSFQIPTERVGLYPDNILGFHFIIEDYMEIKNDTLFNYEIWYSVKNKQKNKVLRVVVSHICTKDIDLKRSSIGTNKPEDEMCTFSIYMMEKKSDNPTRVQCYTYFNNRIKKEETFGMVLIFCDEKVLFDQLMSQLQSP